MTIKMREREEKKERTRNNNEYKREDMLETVKWDHKREMWMRESE